MVQTVAGEEEGRTCSIFVRCNPRVLLIHCSSSFRPLKFALFMPTTLERCRLAVVQRRESIAVRMGYEPAADATTLVHKQMSTSGECNTASRVRETEFKSPAGE